MRDFSEETWRISFWNLWEEWEEEDLGWVLRLFPTPVVFMHWAERAVEELDGDTPWQYTQRFGQERLFEYIGYLANKGYWDKVCQEYHKRQSELAADFLVNERREKAS